MLSLGAYDTLQMAGAGAWSPHGARLALIGPGERVYVVDAERPSAPPSRVAAPEGPVRGLSWSPDGTWLAVVAGPDTDQTVLAVPAAGGRPDTLVRHAALRAAGWAPDGRIYCWVGVHRRALDPPPRWKGASSAAVPPVVEVTDSLDMRLRRWAPGGAEEVLLTGIVVQLRIDPVHPVTVRAVDMLPDGSRSLVGLARDSTARWLVVGPEGRTLLDLRAAGYAFQPTTLSADGRWIGGFTGQWRNGHWQGTRLVVAGVADRWTAPIAGTGAGLGPQFSRSGSYIAFLEPVSGATRIGRLSVLPR
jgi:hypothetical protein